MVVEGEGVLQFSGRGEPGVVEQLGFLLSASSPTAIWSKQGGGEGTPLTFVPAVESPQIHVGMNSRSKVHGVGSFGSTDLVFESLVGEQEGKEVMWGGDYPRALSG